MPISDQQIRDDLQDRLKARAEVIGHEPDGEDVAAVIGETALRFDVSPDRVRDLWVSMICLAGGM